MLLLKSKNCRVDRKCPTFIRLRILVSTISVISTDFRQLEGIDYTVTWIDSELECAIYQSDSIYPRPILGTDCNRV